MTKLSAIIFTHWKDEESYIEICLKTVAWADEIIVVEDNASENTISTIKKYTKKIYSGPGDDFALRRNFAKEKASGQWLLYIDADERVSKSLQDEIQSAIISNEFSAYQLNRINYFLGKKVDYGDRNPDYITRLFKADKLTKWTGAVHETAQIDGPTGKLNSPLYHLTHRDITSMMEKTIAFSRHEAVLRLEANHPPIVWWRFLRVILSEFWKRIVVYQGFRQGTEGWIDGLFQSFSLFIVYARVWEMQRKQSLSKTYEEIDDKILKGDL